MRVVIGVDALIVCRRGGEQFVISVFIVLAVVFGGLVHAEEAHRFEQSEEGHKSRREWCAVAACDGYRVGCPQYWRIARVVRRR